MSEILGLMAFMIVPLPSHGKKDRSPDVDLHFSLFRVDHLTACTDTRNHSDVNGVDIHAYTRIAQNA